MDIHGLVGIASHRGSWRAAQSQMRFRSAALELAPKDPCGSFGRDWEYIVCHEYTGPAVIAPHPEAWLYHVPSVIAAKHLSHFVCTFCTIT